MRHHKELKCAILSLALLVLGACLPLAGAVILAIEPSVLDSKYCLEAHGAVTLRLRMRLRYHNNGTRPVLTPRFYGLLGYKLFRDQDSVARNRPEGQVKFRKQQMLDTAQLDRSKPDPRFFEIVAPGASFAGNSAEVLLLVRSGSGRRSLPDGDRFLRLTIDHWPDRRAPGERLRRSWAALGLLWLDPVESSAGKINVDLKSEPRPCGGHID